MMIEYLVELLRFIFSFDKEYQNEFEKFKGLDYLENLTVCPDQKVAESVSALLKQFFEVEGMALDENPYPQQEVKPILGGITFKI